MTMKTEPFDAVVIGGSFAGLAAALQLARARRRVLVVDAGRPRNRFAKESHGFLGQDGASPADILSSARSQLRRYRTLELCEGEATDARAAEHGFDVALASGESLRARRLVLATGVVDELAPIPGLRELWGRHVLHCPYCHGYEVSGERLGVLAIAEPSVHQALLLPDWSDDVTLFTNGTVEPTAEQREALASRGVRIDPRRVAEIVTDGERLVGVRVAGGSRPDGEVVALDALFTGSRLRMASPIAERLGCAFDDGPFGPAIRTDARKATTVSGVYAAGDAARVQHTVSYAVADGVMAGISAHQSLAIP